MRQTFPFQTNPLEWRYLGNFDSYRGSWYSLLIRIAYSLPFSFMFLIHVTDFAFDKSETCNPFLFSPLCFFYSFA